MEYQSFVDTFAIPCAVLKVEKLPEGICGRIWIHRTNQPYKEIMGPSVYDDMPYEELVPKDVKFENYCFQAAHFGRRMHAYVETAAFDGWIDQQMLPLQKESKTVGYCLFLFEKTKQAEDDRMAEASIESAASIIKCCVALTHSDQFEENLKAVTKDIREIAGADSCRILTIDDEKKEVTTVAESIRMENIRRDDQHDGTIPYEIVKTWEPMIGVSNDVIVTNPYEMDALEKRNPVWVSSMREYYVKTLLLIPLKRGKQIIGYLYAINFDVEKVFELKELAELMSHFIGTELSNHYLMDKLDAMSHTDALTGVGSRRAMLENIEELKTMKPAFPYGIVNMDVNGLKKVNDEEGHAVGDQYIVRAAERMKQVFDPGTIYRSGGDEFIVILRNVSEKTLKQKAEAMRQIQENDEQISIAVGEFWNDGTVPLREAFQKADNAMYEEKRKYYQKA